MDDDDTTTFLEDRPKRRLTIDVNDLAFAFEGSSYEHRWYLDTETGEIVFLSNEWGVEDDEGLRDAIDGDAEGRYLDIPATDSHDGYRDMEDFIGMVGDDRLRRRLDDAISRQRPFRRFKDVLLDAPAERERWFAFQEDRVLERALRWLANEGIEPVLTTRAGGSPPVEGVTIVDFPAHRRSG